MSSYSSSQSTLPAEYTALLNDLNRTIHRERPRDVLQFCANWFNKRLEDQRTDLLHGNSLDPHSPVPPINTRRAQTETIFEEPFAPTSPRSVTQQGAQSSSSNQPERTATQPLPSPSFLTQDPNPTADFPPNYNLSRRTSVSAESLAPQTHQIRRTSGGPTKTPQQEARIRSAISANLLFKNLDDEQTRDVLDSMTEKRIPKEGVIVIRQGDVGDFFYVVEEGSFDFYIKPANANAASGSVLGDKVGSVGPGGSFGELALMYNAPRAASVVSTSTAVLWALDRITFRRILMDHTSRKRKMYEEFLSSVPLLSGLNHWEKAKIADSLETETFLNGEVVIRQGDVGEYFYLVESGEAQAIIEGRGVVKEYKRGDYFGELALLNDAPRAATVRATSNLKVAKLDKRAFQRLLGSIKDIMARESSSYNSSSVTA